MASDLMKTESLINSIDPLTCKMKGIGLIVKQMKYLSINCDFSGNLSVETWNL